MTQRKVRIEDIVATFLDDGSMMVRSVSWGKGARLHPLMMGVLGLCSAPRTRQEVMSVMGMMGGQAFEELSEIGLLVDPEEREAGGEQMFNNFAGVAVHRRMLLDEVRMAAYRDAIAAVVKPGDVVIDAGAGTGALSVYAAKAGASKVYAVEHSEMAAMIPKVAHDSGVGDVIEVVKGNFAKVELPQKARVLITETFGMWGLAEGAAADLAQCAARNLEPDGVLVPGQLDLWMAPLGAMPDKVLTPFARRDDGLDLSSMAEDARHNGAVVKIEPEMLAGPGQKVASLGLTQSSFKATLELDVACEGLALWFDLHLAPGHILSTSPQSPDTHWHQSVVGVSLEAGRHDLVVDMAPDDRRAALLSFGGRPFRLR